MKSAKKIIFSIIAGLILCQPLSAGSFTKDDAIRFASQYKTGNECRSETGEKKAACSVREFISEIDKNMAPGLMASFERQDWNAEEIGAGVFVISEKSIYVSNYNQQEMGNVVYKWVVDLNKKTMSGTDRLSQGVLGLAGYGK